MFSRLTAKPIFTLALSCLVTFNATHSLAVEQNAKAELNPVLDIKHNDNAVVSLKWLYQNDVAFKQLMDNLFADIGPLPNGQPNPWQGKTIEDLYTFVEQWSEFLPTSQNGLSFIRHFQKLIESNTYGRQFVTTEPGLSWTRHLSQVRKLTMLDPKSKEKINQWSQDPRIHIDEYVVPQGGFASFNDFFVRQLKKPRPVNRPHDNAEVSSPADCIVDILPAKLTKQSRIRTKVGQDLKVDQMLAGSKYADKFIGGNAVKCILTPTDYHHYHAPVNGKIVEAREQVDGVLYGGVPGPEMIDNITNFQRGYFIFETESFGHVAMVPIGLATIGSVNFEAPYKHIDDESAVAVQKGERLGRFEYGGSLVILLFEPNRFEILTVAQGSRIGAMQ